MTSKSQSSTNHNHSCCQHKSNLSDSQINHLINTIKLRYISPYKIIYMINQQEADYFKLRNQGSGCCASSLITIPQNQMTKTQLYLFQAIKQTTKSPKLNQILEQLADNYENIVKSGEKQNLKVDKQVEKFLMEKTLSQGFNLQLFKTVADRLKKDDQQISNSAMLWATPNTWYAKYPKTPLNFLSSQTLSSLNNPNQGFAFQPAFLKDYKDNLLKELILLQRDSKFEEQIWAKQQEHIRSDKKVLSGLEKFSFDGSEDSYREGQIKYPNLKRSLLTLRSIPFELNAKLNAFCTISENNQVSYFKENLVYKVKESAKVCRYSTFCLIGDGKVNCWIKGKKNETRSQEKCLQSGQLVLVDNELCEVQLEGKGDTLFLFKSWIGTLAKKA